MNTVLSNLKSDKIQIIKHTAADAECSSTIFSSDVVVQCRPGGHNHGSSKIKLINRIDYNWELRYYLGQLVAAHSALNIIAYAMKGKDGGMVRILNQATNQRALIKNLKTDVRDVSFAFIKSEILLGCVDDEGNVYIYEIIDKPKEITYVLLLHIYHGEYEGAAPSNFKLVWCPYLPAPDEDVQAAEDAAKMFVFLNGTKAEVWDVSMTVAKYGSGPVITKENYECFVQVEHEMDLIDAAYSSDGTAIATACVNGFVYFYQIYMVGNMKQKLLHEWKPHDGKPLSCLIFIDNVLDYSSDSRFWKFAITGANHNQEIKLWSCENWSCLQTIHFKADANCIIPSVFLKIRIDYTGQHVVMCDINNKVLYVLKLEKNDVEKLVGITMISEFLLPAPFLSYHITEANVSKMPLSGGSDDEDYYCEDEEDSLLDAVVIKMLVIQPKKFQECEIVFHPERLLSTKMETLPLTCKNEETADIIPKLDDLQSSVTLLIHKQTNKSQLICPETFTSPRQSSQPHTKHNSLDNNATPDNGTVAKIVPNDVNLIDFERPQKENFASASSSPSREVQEILSLNRSKYSTQESFENMTKTVEAEQPQKPYSQSDGNYTEKATDTVWPKIPVVKDDELIEKDRNTFHTNFADSKSEDQLSIINYRLTSLENTLRRQTIHIEQLNNEIKGMTQAKLDMIDVASKKDIAKELEVALSKQHLQIAKLLENLVNIQKNNEHEKLEHFTGRITEILAKTVTENLNSIVIQEMKMALNPLIRSMLESWKHQFDVQCSQKLQSTELMLRESIAQVVNNKALADALGLSVVGVVTPVLETCYRDMVAKSLVPSCEKVCGNMFQQINATFTQGTKEYTASVENYMERQRKVQDKGGDLIKQLQSASDALRANADKFSATVSAEIGKQLEGALKAGQEGVLSGIRDVVAEQVRQGFKSQVSVIEDSVINAVRSRAVTPSPHVMDSQAQLAVIQTHLAKGGHVEAFQTALGAENLSLVIYVCEKVDVQQFFEEGPPLPQNCLLALIQQLSVDLSKHTDLKISYIRASFLALAPDDRNIKAFMPKILLDLQKKLQVFMASSPSAKYLTDARLLKMAVDSLLMAK